MVVVFTNPREIYGPLNWPLMGNTRNMAVGIQHPEPGEGEQRTYWTLHIFISACHHGHPTGIKNKNGLIERRCPQWDGRAEP